MEVFRFQAQCEGCAVMSPGVQAADATSARFVLRATGWSFDDVVSCPTCKAERARQKEARARHGRRRKKPGGSVPKA